MSEDSQTIIKHLESDVSSQINLSEPFKNRLFVGVIDINKWEEDARELYNRLLSEGDRFKTKFWEGVIPKKSQQTLLQFPETVEELEEVEKVHAEIDHALKSFNPFMPRNQYFKPRSVDAKRFLSNIEFINMQLSVHGMREECVSSFLGIREKEFRRLLRYYSKPRWASIQAFTQKQSDKAKFDSEIAEELGKYVRTKIGQWITTRMMRDHLLSTFKQRLDSGSEVNFKTSTLSPFNIRRILRVYMDYTWRKCKQRAPNSTRGLTEKRKLFAKLIRKLESLGFNIIYIDEASVCPQNIMLYSWWHKYKPDPIIRPSARINVVAAMILPHKYAFMLKTGSTKSEHIIFFFELLHAKLCDWFGKEYLGSTIVVLDNASVHLSSNCRSYFSSKGLSVLTLPPYTPEQNNVEQVFKRLKTDLSKRDLAKKRLEYIVADTIMRMK